MVTGVLANSLGGLGERYVEGRPSLTRPGHKEFPSKTKKAVEDEKGLIVWVFFVYIVLSLDNSLQRNCVVVMGAVRRPKRPKSFRFFSGKAFLLRGHDKSFPSTLFIIHAGSRLLNRHNGMIKY
jgi:hypothetical protein